MSYNVAEYGRLFSYAFCFCYVVLNAAPRRSFLFRHKGTHYLYMQGLTMLFFVWQDEGGVLLNDGMRFLNILEGNHAMYVERHD